MQVRLFVCGVFLRMTGEEGKNKDTDQQVDRIQADNLAAKSY